jgi:hypothetical protein
MSMDLAKPHICSEKSRAIHGAAIPVVGLS